MVLALGWGNGEKGDISENMTCSRHSTECGPCFQCNYEIRGSEGRIPVYTLQSRGNDEGVGF